MPRLRINIFRLIILLFIATLCFPTAVYAAKKKSFVVVLDPGHGGKDIGASENNVKEKDVNLAVATRVAEILKKKKGFKVIMTRNSDKFVSLNGRAEKANKEKADLFISIHCNSLDEDNENRRSIQGSQVYVLGLHDDKENLNVAQRENSVITQENDFEDEYDGFDPEEDEAYLAIEMQKVNNLNNSMGFAQEVMHELQKKAGRMDRGVRQAGFFVLRETNMPGVLIELDFLCNPNMATYLRSTTGQGKLARAIASAVENYRKKIEKHANKAYAEQQQDEGRAGSYYVLTGYDNNDVKTKSKHKNNNGRKSNGPRRRRSASARQASLSTSYERQVNTFTESYGVIVAEQVSYSEDSGNLIPDENKKGKSSKNDNKKKDKKKDKKQDKKKGKNAEQVRIVNGQKVKVSEARPDNPRSLKSSRTSGESDFEKAIERDNAAESGASASGSVADKEESSVTVSSRDIPEDNSDVRKSSRQQKVRQTPKNSSRTYKTEKKVSAKKEAKEVKNSGDSRKYNSVGENKVKKEEPEKKVDPRKNKKEDKDKKNKKDNKKKEDKKDKKKHDSDNVKNNVNSYNEVKNKADEKSSKSDPRSLKSKRRRH